MKHQSRGLHRNQWNHWETGKSLKKDWWLNFQTHQTAFCIPDWTGMTYIFRMILNPQRNSFYSQNTISKKINQIIYLSFPGQKSSTFHTQKNPILNGWISILVINEPINSIKDGLYSWGLLVCGMRQARRGRRWMFSLTVLGFVWMCECCRSDKVLADARLCQRFWSCSTEAGVTRAPFASFLLLIPSFLRRRGLGNVASCLARERDGIYGWAWSQSPECYA